MKTSIDAVSLIFILKIPALEQVVRPYIERAYVTNAVYKEVFETKGSEEIANIQSYFDVWLERKDPKKIIQTKLGTGELSAISLAHEQKIAFISEDRKALLFANSIGVKTTTLLSILLKAKDEEEIDPETAKSVLFKLVETGYYMSSELFAFMLKKIEG